jgi:hypothetical protein
MYTCAVCGKALGMYEPLVWVRSDTVVEGSLTTLKEDAALDPPPRGCCTPSAPAGLPGDR